MTGIVPAYSAGRKECVGVENAADYCVLSWTCLNVIALAATIRENIMTIS